MKSILILSATILLLSSCTNKSNPGGADSKYYAEPTTGPGQNSHGLRSTDTSGTAVNIDSSMKYQSPAATNDTNLGGNTK